MPFELTAENAVEYLASRGLLSPARVVSAELLGWGVSNTLVRVCLPDDCLVIKQSLARLRVAEEWLADRDRIQREQACIEVLASVLPGGCLPRLRHADPENFLFVMSCAPDDSVNWKEQLLAGVVNLEVARRVGELLGRVHRDTGDDARIRERFIDTQAFIQLRIDPYHRTVARAHPDLAPVILREAERMLGVQRVLVHGDYSPKNVMVSGSVSGSEVFLLDFEVAHYGNPVFDLAFMLSHLYLKAIHLPGSRRELYGAVAAFWSGYASQFAGRCQLECLEARERDSVPQLGCLLLARVDGKSPVEYITHPVVRDLVRGIARSLLREPVESLAGVTALVSTQTDSISLA